jgi:hypothetical protein
MVGKGQNGPETSHLTSQEKVGYCWMDVKSLADVRGRSKHGKWVGDSRRQPQEQFRALILLGVDS